MAGDDQAVVALAKELAKGLKAESLEDVGVTTVPVVIKGGALAGSTKLRSLLSLQQERGAIVKILQDAGISRSAARALVLMHKQQPLQPKVGVGVIQQQQIRVNLIRRAQYLINAGRRLQREIDAQQSLPGNSKLSAARAMADVLRQEQRFYQLHLNASYGRELAASQVDFAAARYGDRLGWYATMDSRTSADCAQANGKNFSVHKAPALGWPGMVHPTCVPGDTKIWGSSILGATRRWYEGHMVTVVTKTGHRLTITPNHQVLTAKGWVAASLLNEGDDVVCGVLGDPSPADDGCPHDNDVHPSIEDVFDALSVTCVAVPGTAEQFHNDGTDSQVTTVAANSALMNWLKAAKTQPGIDHKLTESNMIADSTLATLCAIDELVCSWRTECSPGAFSELLVLLWGSCSGHQSVRVGSRSDGDLLLRERLLHHSSGGAEDASYRWSTSSLAVQISDLLCMCDQECASVRSPSLICRGSGAGTTFLDGRKKAESVELAIEDLLLDAQRPDDLDGAGAAKVHLDRVIDIRMDFCWSGHVFNLETVSGAYVADGIVSHNCRCWAGAPHVNGGSVYAVGGAE